MSQSQHRTNIPTCNCPGTQTSTSAAGDSGHWQSGFHLHHGAYLCTKAWIFSQTHRLTALSFIFPPGFSVLHIFTLTFSFLADALIESDFRKYTQRGQATSSNSNTWNSLCLNRDTSTRPEQCGTVSSFTQCSSHYRCFFSHALLLKTKAHHPLRIQKHMGLCPCPSVPSLICARLSSSPWQLPQVSLACPDSRSVFHCPCTCERVAKLN